MSATPNAKSRTSIARSAGRIAGRASTRRFRKAAWTCGALAVVAYGFRDSYSPSRALEPGMLFLARQDSVDGLSRGLLALTPLDVDGDGAPELVLGVSQSANGRVDRIEAWRKDGSVVASWATSTWASSPLGPWKWAESVGDTDGDGLGEVLIDGPRLVTLATGVERALAFDGRESAAAASADLDGDGLADVAVAGYDRARRCVVRALQGSSGAALWSQLRDNEPIPRAASVQMELVRVDDLDGDNVADFAWLTATRLGRGRVLLLSGANGVVLRDVENDRWRHIGSAGDVDGDGRQDLVLHDDRVAVVLTEVALAHGLGVERFRIELPGDRDARVFAIGDLDGDGCNEIVAAASRSFSKRGAANIVRGADGRLLRRIEFAEQLHATPAGIANVGDLDRDGIDDLMVCSPELGEVEWLPAAWRVARQSWVAVYSGRFVAASNDTLQIR